MGVNIRAFAGRRTAAEGHAAVVRDAHRAKKKTLCPLSRREILAGEAAFALIFGPENSIISGKSRCITQGFYR
jgi:hypothetical protein